MHNWKNIILKENNTMQDAIEVLDRESLRIVIVVDNENRIIGTITDGDIRRGLLEHLSMDAMLSEFMFIKPTVAFVGSSKGEILEKMKRLDLLQIPIIDENKRVVGLETLHNIIKNNRHDNPVVLMAGGFGKRLKPLTDSTPKPLIKVGDRPILQSILEQFIDAGFCNFYISIYYKSEMIREFFGDGTDWNVSIKYIHESAPLGTAGCLGLLSDERSDLPILMMNGDLLTKVNFEELLDFHSQNGGDATMCVREYDFQVPYGVVTAKGHRITSIEEKPKHTFFVNAGVYVLNPSMLTEIDGLSYLDMPDLIENKINNSGQINMFPVHEYWLDIGSIDQLNQAKQDYSGL